MNVCMPDSFTSFCCPLLISALTLVLLHKYEYRTFTSVFQWNLMLSGKQSDLDLMSTDVFTRFSQLILDLLSFLKMTSGFSRTRVYPSFYGTLANST